MKKKTIAFLMAFILLLSLSACGIGQRFVPSATEHFTDTPAETEETTLPTQAPEPQKTMLTLNELIAHINSIGASTGVPSGFLSNLSTKPNENGSGITTSFTYYGDLVSASVTEENGIVQTIMITALPTKFAEAYSADSGLAYAYVACLQLLECCESGKDTDWHSAQRKNAPEEGDQSTSMRTYKTEEWMYTAIINEYFITLTAARYCKQCNGNAPKISFSSDSSLCCICQNTSGAISTPPTQNLTLSQVLDLSKVWMFEFSAGGLEGVFYYAFEEDGTCYVVLGDGLEPWYGGVGTYQFNGNSLDFSIVTYGAPMEYGYSYNYQTKTLTQTHGTPLTPALTGFRGQHQFVEDDVNDVAKIREMATAFAEA